MLLVPRWVAISFVLIVLVAILGIGALGYLSIEEDLPPEEAKPASELVLYLSIVAATAVAFFLAFVLGRTRNISRELDKMVMLNRYGDFSPELSMKKLGAIGKKITLLYFRLNALSEKRSLKIGALSNLVRLLARNLEKPIVVSDISGSVLYVSREIGEKYSLSRSELLNSKVSRLVPEVNVQLAITKVERANQPQSISGGSDPVSVIPIRDTRNALTYVVWVLSREGLDAETGERMETPVGVPTGPGLLRRIFSRVYQKGAKS